MEDPVPIYLAHSSAVQIARSASQCVPYSSGVIYPIYMVSVKRKTQHEQTYTKYIQNMSGQKEYNKPAQ